jgi:UDP-N-acetylglucosamine--N-acetylmuramyl-(pentapeptide) pyrophosphoryl-undecaprenol N-acetylglucosamine transferase
MERFFPADKLVLTGNPIRQSLLNLKLGREEAAQHFKLDPQKSTVLLMGGSLGARTINKSVEEFLTNVPEDVQLLWQTGASYSEEEGNFEWGKRIKFIRRMDLAYSLADVVISRAGALSISELCAIGKACIFVPSPNVTEDHQTRNAMNLVERGAALMCRDQDARTQLMEMSIRLLRDEEKRKELVHANRSMGKPNATEDILKELEALLGNV